MIAFDRLSLVRLSDESTVEANSNQSIGHLLSLNLIDYGI